MLKGILENTCPRCHRGHVFKSFLKMNKTCPECGYQFERGPGYFYGAVFLHYVLLSLAVVPVMVAGLVLNAELVGIGVIAVIEVVLFSPFVYRISRLAWIHMDFKTDQPQS